jgi:SHS2 domain-containing protein
MPYTVSSFDHTADRGIIVRAPRREDLFIGAAIGMFASMYALEGIRPDRERHVSVAAPDQEALLVAWLQELIFLFEVEGEIYTDATVHELTPVSLRATVRGHALGPEVVQIGAAVKAVTYHGLSLRPVASGWEATLLFDV